MRACLPYLVIIAALCAAIPTYVGAQAERPAATQGAAACDLGAVQNMKHFAGTAAAKTILARNRFVVTDKQFKQIFSAYIGSPLPKFITTDSAWHTYHVLLEEGVKQLEVAQAGRLRDFSSKLVAAARQRAKAGQGAYEQLAQYASVPLALQDPAFLKSLEKDSPPAAAMVRALQSGGGLVKVPIGLPLMPERFRAKSFYTKSPQLAAYFAARQWYAVVDFRLNSEDETALALKLAGLIKGDAELSRLHDRLSTPYDLLLAPAEDGDVKTYAKAAADHKTTGAARKALASRLPDPKVNDQILTPAQYANFAAEIKGFRLLPPRRVPSAVCFQNTVDPKIKGRMFPSGLDFLASCKTLRSPAAERALQMQSGKAATQAILQAGPAKLPDSLHGQALKLLAKLQQPVTKAAPAAMKTDAWRDKQLWTQLGAWAEQRHTWALHTKLNIHYLGATQEHLGIVSPYPEFFDALAALSRATAKALAATDLARDFDAPNAAQDLLDHIDFFNRLKSTKAAARAGDNKARKEMATLRGMRGKFLHLMNFLMLYGKKFDVPLKSEKEAEPLLKEMAKMARKCAAGGELKKTEIETLKLFAYSSSTGKIDPLLKQFAGVCDTLANIARKQLAGGKLTKQDRAFIKKYGITLARFHFYGGNSYLTPRDDFPIVTPIFISPPGNQCAVLYAGLARPQALYVIAPVDAKPVLHLGAVLSYREFRRPVSEPLDDAAWTAQVHKGPLPAPPKFTQSFAAGITPREVIEILAKGEIYEDIDNIPSREITEAIVRILDKGASRQTYWLVDHLIHRCMDRDAGDLIRLMAKFPSEGLAFKVAEMPWKDHRDALMAMLHGDKPKLADSAAYVMSNRPGDIDCGPLLAGFDKKTIRTRRLYCFLLGYVPKADPRLTKTLLKALGDSDAGLRWQAVMAIGQGGLKDAAVVKALVARIEDANEFVASAAVQTLAKLKASEAAPAMLARLKRGVRPRNITDNESRNQGQAILGATEYGGRTALMVLRPRGGFGFGGLTSLGQALVEALGRFRYKPAKDQLVKMLDGNYCPDAIEALQEVAPEGLKERLLGMLTGSNAMSALDGLEKMEPDKHVGRLITVALDRKADRHSRRRVLMELMELRSKGGAATAARLIPLLDDTTGFEYEDTWMRDYAAAVMGSMLGWQRGGTPDRDAEVRKKLIARVKKWAKDRTATSGPSTGPGATLNQLKQ